MKQYFATFLILFFFSFTLWGGLFEDTKEIPVVYKGRIRPLDPSSRLWLYELTHREKWEDSSLDFLWKMHFLGHAPWDHVPLFWIQRAQTKKALGLETKRARFSFNELSFLQDPKTNDQPIFDISQLFQLLNQYRHYTDSVEQNEDFGLLSTRLAQAGTSIVALPGRFIGGEWFSLKALKIKVFDRVKEEFAPVKNFTLFSDERFEKIRSAYLSIESAILHAEKNGEELKNQIRLLTNELKAGYASLAGTAYKEAAGKTLSYPSPTQIHLEQLYYEYPLIEMSLIGYAIALVFFLFRSKISFIASIICLLGAFSLHTLILAMRCFILQRPPVSNMFETILYVPWIAVLASFVLFYIFKNQIPLIASSIAALALLVLLKLTGINSSLENVQAVLDSQYWLIIHVLMVVGSYGAFILAGILGHFYLIGFVKNKFETQPLASIAKLILQSMYLGVALLIPGTILGGVWAAESWGRFWDWDPKESWAFISACIYLIFIHAYTFGHIRNLGLAMGSIAGMLAISFTWYGVNYILGTGLHTYGFGVGGVGYYYLYFLIEIFFLFIIFFIYFSRDRKYVEKNQKNEI